MRTKTLLFSSVAIIFLSACGSRQYYTPKQTQSLSPKSGLEVVSLSRDAAMLEDGTVLSRDGVINLKLGKGYTLIHRGDQALLIADKRGNIKVIDRAKKSIDIHLPQALVAGTVIGERLIYLLQDNSFGVYDLNLKKVLYNNKAQKALSIDTRIANPYQIDNLVVIPTLNGKLNILDLTSLKVVKELYVSTENTLNNVIFLGRLDNTLIAATPYRVISVSSQGQRSFEKAISEVVIDNQSLFVFAKDGIISELDASMKVLNEKKFKFAHFSIATIKHGKIYAMDKQGYLIVSNRALSKYRVYELPEIDGYAFVAGEKLYYDGNVVDLSSLSYK
jgi:hypothetical protein